MPQLTVEESKILARWDTLMRGPDHGAWFKELVQAAAEKFPDETRSVVLPFRDLDVRDPDLADALLNYPRLVLQLGTQKMHEVDITVDPKPRLHLRVSGLAPQRHRQVRQLRAEDLERYISVDGLVKRTIDVRPLVLEAAWDCKTCGNRIRLVQDAEAALAEPVVCDGCEKQGPWHHRKEESRWIDHQKVQLQDLPEGLRGAQASDLAVHLEDDLVAVVAAGKRARITGILTTREVRKNNQVQAAHEQVLVAVHVELLEQSLEDIVLNEQDVEAVKQLAARPDAWEVLCRSYAPDIHGHDIVKEGLVLSLFSGDQTVGLPAGPARWHSHVFLVGDSAVGKTQLLRWGTQLVPRSIYVDTPNSSGAGLTAAATPDDFGGTTRWTVDAGVGPMADGALVAADELDKGRPEDMGRLNGMLENGCVDFAKAGLNLQLRARLRFWGGANPEDGKFDPEAGDLYGQINLGKNGPSLISRFDLIFGMRDVANLKVDIAVAKASARRFQKAENVQRPEGLVGVDLYRKVLAWALRYTPELPQDVIDYVATTYGESRAHASERGLPLPHNPRSNDGLYRLAVASARAHLRPAVTREDADRARRVQLAALHSIGVVDEKGVVDLGVLETGFTRSQHERLDAVLELVRDLCQATGHAKVDDVLAGAKAKLGMSNAETQKALDALRRANRTYAKGGGSTVAPLVN